MIVSAIGFNTAVPLRTCEQKAPCASVRVATVSLGTRTFQLGWNPAYALSWSRTPLHYTLLLPTIWC